MFHTKVVEKIKTHFMFDHYFSKIVLFMMRSCGKILYSRTGHRCHYGARTLQAGYLSLQTYTHNVWYSLLYRCNIGCTNAPQSYVIRTFLVLLKSIHMHENIDKYVWQMRFISYLTENTICLYDGACVWSGQNIGLCMCYTWWHT